MANIRHRTHERERQEPLQEFLESIRRKGCWWSDRPRYALPLSNTETLIISRYTQGRIFAFLIKEYFPKTVQKSYQGTRNRTGATFSWVSALAGSVLFVFRACQHFAALGLHEQYLRWNPDLLKRILLPAPHCTPWWFACASVAVQSCSVFQSVQTA